MKLDRTSLFSLEGRTAVITGATGFLGRTFTNVLLENGARVIALGRSTRLDELTADWSQRFGSERVSSFRIDMYDLTAFTRVLDGIAEREARLDVLVNNAHELGPDTGFNRPNGGLDGATYDEWMRNLTGGVYWAALTVERLGKVMKTAGSGSIINISTMYALVAPDARLYAGTKFMNPPGYSASKAALLSFTRYVASFWGEYGVRANALLPGPFSNLEDQGGNSVPAGDEFLDRLRDRTCLRRIGHAHELAGPLLFLASDASSYVTGHGFVVDGGWTVT